MINSENFFDALTVRLVSPLHKRPKPLKFMSQPISLNEAVDMDWSTFQQMYRLQLHWGVHIFANSDLDAELIRVEAITMLKRKCYSDIIPLIHELVFLAKNGREEDINEICEMLLDIVEG